MEKGFFYDFQLDKKEHPGFVFVLLNLAAIGQSFYNFVYGSALQHFTYFNFLLL
jgi:hypothetical protein